MEAQPLTKKTAPTVHIKVSILEEVGELHVINNLTPRIRECKMRIRPILTDSLVISCFHPIGENLSFARIAVIPMNPEHK
jgi:hypothetical protein